jgi:hypothetical protein
VTVFDHAVHKDVVSAAAGMIAKKPYCFSVRHKDSGDAKVPVYAVDTRDGLTEWLLMIARSNVSILAPEFRSAGGTFEGGLSVFIDCDTPGTSIVYDVNAAAGAPPPNSSDEWLRLASFPQPEGGFGGKYGAGKGVDLREPGTFRVRALAYMKGCPDSAVATATYTVLPAVPEGGAELFTYLTVKLADNVAHGSDRGEAYHLTIRALRLFKDDLLSPDCIAAVPPEAVAGLMRVSENLPNVCRNAAQAEAALEVCEEVSARLREVGLLQDSLTLLQHCIALQTVVLDKTTGARSFDGSVVSGQQSSKRAPKPWGSSTGKSTASRLSSGKQQGGSGKTTTASGRERRSRSPNASGKRSKSPPRSGSASGTKGDTAEGGGEGGGGTGKEPKRSKSKEGMQQDLKANDLNKF